MKRFYFIFGITAVLVLIILFYNPNAKYLGVYKESMTIEYDFEDIEGYDWFYDVTSDIFDISATSGSKWKLLPKKDGVTTITFYSSNSGFNRNTLTFFEDIKSCFKIPVFIAFIML